jgi:hypothetical protein
VTIQDVFHHFWAPMSQKPLFMFSIPGVLVCVVVLSSVLCLTGCEQSPAKELDAGTVQVSLRPDETERLKLLLDELLQLEQEKKVGVLYDDYASLELKNRIPRAVFTKTIYCGQQHLGSIQSWDKKTRQFSQKKLKNKKLLGVSVLVSRSNETLRERLVFVEEGIDFKLSGMYWLSNNKQYLQCLKEKSSGTDVLLPIVKPAPKL